MTTIQEDDQTVQQPERFPENTPETVARGIEFTVAISSEENQESTDSPMLDALTTYREEQLN